MMDAIRRRTRIIITPSVQIEVFRAKKIDHSEWEGMDLRSQILRARESYIDRYGKVNRLDRFDKNSAIYLVRTQYKDSENKETEECLSARFLIPHTYLSTNETDKLLQSCYLGHPLIEMLQKFSPYRKKDIAVVSRICGFRSPQEKKSGEKNKHILALQHTAIAFMLMVDQFIADYNLGDIRFILGLFRGELIRKALTVVALDQTVPKFHFGTLLFPGSVRNEFCINRNYSAYEFPSYFLNTEKLGRTLREMIRTGLLKKEHVASHFTEPRLIEDLIKGKTIPYHEFRFFGKLLNHKGVIPGSGTSGDELRVILGAEVPDGPELRVIKTNRFKQHTDRGIAQLLQTP
jgi:hypothetical protein